MRVKFDITVTSDDGRASRTVTSELALATGIEGVDASAAKQDFLQQAEGLLRSIVDNQLPAMYQVVDDAGRMLAGSADGGTSEAQAKAKAQLDKIRERQNAGQEAAQ